MASSDLRDCGDCNLCCKLPGVSQLGKLPGVWCQHCTPGSSSGCSIYSQRPSQCAEFSCLWRDGHLPEDLRPDKSKVMVTKNDKGELVIWEQAPGASRKRKVREAVMVLKPDRVIGRRAYRLGV